MRISCDRNSLPARLVVFALMAVLAGTAYAAHPTKERGFRSDSLYQFTDLDTVNLFNGTINLGIPMGQPYPISANLSYAFTLRYAGNVWQLTEACGGGGLPGGQNPPEACHEHMIPSFDNAGLGWDLSFGELRKHVVPIASGDVD